MKLAIHTREILIILFTIVILYFYFDSFKYFKSKINKIVTRIEDGKILTSTQKKDEHYFLNHDNKDILEKTNTVNIIGKNRYDSMINFLNMYRNMGNSTNTVMLGDIINEFMVDYLDTLYLPFDGSKYCYDLDSSNWCLIQSMDLFIYPKIIKYKKYQPKLNPEKYKDIKKRISISLNGSDGTILNLTIPQSINDGRAFYLYGYKNEVFVHNYYKG